MADNPTVKSGVGGDDITVAGDDVGGAIHQYVKIEFGADNTATKVSSSDPLPIHEIKGDTGSQGTVNVDTGAGGDQILAAGTTRKAVWLENRGAVYVDVGFGSSITAGHGIRLYPGDRMWITEAANAEIRAISSSGTVAVSYLVEDA